MPNDSLQDNQRDWPEGSTPTITFYLLDISGNPITLANVQTLKLSQWLDQGNDRAGLTINSRNVQNALNTNGVTVDATSGLVTWLLSASDTAMQSKDLTAGEERHCFRFDLAYTSSAGTIKHSGPGVNGDDYYVVHRKKVLR